MVHSYSKCRIESIEYEYKSHSVDELNGREKSSEEYQRRDVKTPDFLEQNEEGRQKHVSFDSSALVRSNTVGGGLEGDINAQTSNLPYNINDMLDPQNRR